MKNKKCKIKLEGYDIERMRSIVNAIKDFNNITSDKASIDYDTIRELDGADDFLLGFLVYISQVMKILHVTGI